MVEGHLGETYLPQLAIKSGILTNSSLCSESIPETTASRTLSLVWRKTSHRRVFFAQIGDSIKQVLEEILNK